jgi:hypothetical protein
VKFSRKSSPATARAETAEAETAEVETAVDAAADSAERVEGPHDIADVDVEGDDVDRVDLGGLLVAPVGGLELRLQVDEATQTVQSVMVAGPEGGVELRAFAAARGEDMWPEVRKQIAADLAQRGGVSDEREGRWGKELTCQLQVTMDDGRVGRQDSRIVGISGPRWFLRATFVGRPALDPEHAAAFEEVLTSLVVRRGAGAMAPGDPLPLTLPPQARRVQA